MVVVHVYVYVRGYVCLCVCVSVSVISSVIDCDSGTYECWVKNNAIKGERCRLTLSYLPIETSHKMPEEEYTDTPTIYI